MNASKPYILIAVVVLLVGTIYFINSNSVKRAGSDQVVTVIPRVPFKSNSAATSPSTEVKKDTMPSKFFSREVKSKRYELAKEITTPDGFINTDGKPITINSLIGKKVILVDFWTYSCINCQRTTPYLNAWYEKYKDKGFVIIGVHTPEFEFEKDYNNVKVAVEKFGIKFPVVLDNDYSTWTAYKNQYWPRKYLIDIDGYVIYDHIGEGGYEETERKIQEALAERMTVLGESGTINQGVTKELPQEGGLKSRETYFGAARNEFLANGIKGRAGAQQFSEPTTIEPNKLYLVGNWNIQDEFATSASVNAKVIYRYQAKHVYFVAGADKSITIQLLRDGKSLGSKTINGHELYTLVDEPDYTEHTLEIIIPASGLQAFTFTFG